MSKLIFLYVLLEMFKSRNQKVSYCNFVAPLKFKHQKKDTFSQKKVSFISLGNPFGYLRKIFLYNFEDLINPLDYF